MFGDHPTRQGISDRAYFAGIAQQEFMRAALAAKEELDPRDLVEHCAKLPTRWNGDSQRWTSRPATTWNTSDRIDAED